MCDRPAAANARPWPSHPHPHHLTPAHTNSHQLTTTQLPACRRHARPRQRCLRHLSHCPRGGPPPVVAAARRTVCSALPERPTRRLLSSSASLAVCHGRPCLTTRPCRAGAPHVLGPLSPNPNQNGARPALLAQSCSTYIILPLLPCCWPPSRPPPSDPIRPFACTIYTHPHPHPHTLSIQPPVSLCCLRRPVCHHPSPHAVCLVVSSTRILSHTSHTSHTIGPYSLHASSFMPHHQTPNRAS